MEHVNCVYGIINNSTGVILRKFDNKGEAEHFVRLTQPEGYADLRVVMVAERK